MTKKGAFLIVYPDKDARTSFEFKFWVGDVPPPWNIFDYTMEILIVMLVIVVVVLLFL
jgi:hypothetical protein